MVSVIPAGASESPSIVKTWEFGGGAVVIKPSQSEPASYEGVVVQPNTFAECTHQEGERMWTKMVEQSDGSFYGQHQWFYEHKNCERNPVRGPTAWRVFKNSKGGEYLEVCFSRPGTTQPTIAANGTTSGVTYKCYESKLIGEVPEGVITENTTTSASGGSGNPTTATGGQAAFIERLLKPSAAQCVSGRRFEIHLAEPYLDPFKAVRVALRGKALKTVKRGGYVDATINLKGLHTGTFTIKITATTVLDVHLSGSRTYHTCAKKPKHKKPAKLKVVH